MSKEEAHRRERLLPALPEEPPVHQCQNRAGSYSSPQKDSVFKIESSSECLRQYIPGAGLTTYTIVPSKSLKTKYFEVELTLEDPVVALKDNNDRSSPMLSIPGSGEPQVSVSESSLTQEEQLSNETLIAENVDCADTAPTLPVPAEAPEVNSQPTSSYDGTFEAGPEQDIKARKTPPALKPKPASFLLPHQTRTCVEYVSSAERKSNVCAIFHCGEEDEDDSGRAGKGEPMGDKGGERLPTYASLSTFPSSSSYSPHRAKSYRRGSRSMR